MFLSASSLSTRLYSLTGVTNKPRAPSNFSEPDLKAILRTIRWVSDLGLGSMTLSIESIGQLNLLSEEENSKELFNQCSRSSVKTDHIYTSFIPSLVFNRDVETELGRVWKKIAYLSKIIGAETIEMLSPALPLDGNGSQVVGGGYELAWLNSSFSWRRIWEKYASSMRFISKLAEGSGMKIAIEPRQAEMINDPDLLMNLFDDVDSDSLGAVVDVSRMYISKDIPPLSIRKLDKKIFSVHLSDSDGVTQWHWAPGQGKIDWMSVFKALAVVKYDGILSLDVSGMDVEREILEGKKFVETLLQSIGSPLKAASSTTMTRRS